MYRLNRALLAAGENELAVEIGGDDGADGPNGPGHGGERERVLEGPLIDASAIYRTTLLREWLYIAIKPADIVSVQRQNDKEPIVAFQILELYQCCEDVRPTRILGTLVERSTIGYRSSRRCLLLKVLGG